MGCTIPSFYYRIFRKEVISEMEYSVWAEKYGRYRFLCSFDAGDDEAAEKIVVSEEGEVTQLILPSRILRISELDDLTKDRLKSIRVVMVEGHSSPDGGPVRSHIVGTVKIIKQWRFSLGLILDR